MSHDDLTTHASSDVQYNRWKAGGSSFTFYKHLRIILTDIRQKRKCTAMLHSHIVQYTDVLFPQNDPINRCR